MNWLTILDTDINELVGFEFDEKETDVAKHILKLLDVLNIPAQIDHVVDENNDFSDAKQLDINQAMLTFIQNKVTKKANEAVNEIFNF